MYMCVHSRLGPFSRVSSGSCFIVRSVYRCSARERERERQGRGQVRFNGEHRSSWSTAHADNLIASLASVSQLVLGAKGSLERVCRAFVRVRVRAARGTQRDPPVSQGAL
jgi:hypothetical protein